MNNNDQEQLKALIRENRVTMAYIPDDKINIETVLNYLDQSSDSGKKIYISTDGSPTNCRGNIDIKTPEDIDINFVVDKDLRVQEKTLIKLRKLLEEYDHIFIGEMDKLCEILVTDSTERKRCSRSKIIETFNAITFGENIGKFVVLTYKPGVKQIMETTQTPGKVYAELSNIPHPESHQSSPKNTSEMIEMRFMERVDIEQKTPKVNIWRIDEIIAKNKAFYGEMMFFANAQGHEITKVALDTIISNAPISEQLCYITPFRNEKEVKQSLYRLHPVYPLKLQALERTVFYTSESLNSANLNNKNALMNMIKNAIVNFKKKLDKMGHNKGICIIDTIGIDTYGAEIDHPSLRWYAKTHNILIIIGAETAMERYTYERQKISHKKMDFMLPNLKAEV